MEYGKLSLFAIFCIILNCNTVFARECAPVGDNCTLPWCLCPDWNPPNGLNPSAVPQMVFLTFDDAITVSNYPLYEQIGLFDRKNPNDAVITSTYYITHEYNDYQLTHEMYRKGNEIALHSLTHKTDTNYWSTMNESTWAADVCAQKDTISHFARIPKEKITGFRVPFLQLGGDRQYTALSEPDCGLEYDCSRPTRLYAGPNPAKLWPYTMDYDMAFQDCQNAPCPLKSYPGFWTVPMVSLFGNNTFPCAMVDTCLPQPTTREETLQLLKFNFERHYLLPNAGIGNRAPFGVFTHAAWLQGEDNLGRLNGYTDFLDYLGGLADVYIVSVAKGLEWMRAPVNLTNIKDFEAWQDEEPPTNQCSFAFPCAFTDAQTPFPGERYMQSCQPCPRNYPWIHNPLGNL